MVDAKKSAPANRGKKAEKRVYEVLDAFNSRVAGFTFNRNLDAHAAGGRFPAQAGDFQSFCKYKERQIGPNAWVNDEHSRNFIIEVKEVAHDHLLPHKNYSADKVARVQKRVWAGTEAIVAVLHTTTGLWRLVPFDVFTKREGGSWNLTMYPLVDPESALAEFMGVN